MPAATEPQAYIQFETRAVKYWKEDDDGLAVETFKDVDFAIIIPPGDAKTVVEKKVDPDIMKRFRPQYEAFKAGQEIPLEGTPVKEWAMLRPSEVAMLLKANVRTIEDLAHCNESTLERIGMGSRALKLKAQSYLDATQGPGALVSKMTALSTKMDEVLESNAEKDRENKDLRAELDALRKNQPPGEGGRSKETAEAEADFVYGDDPEPEPELKHPPLSVPKKRKPGPRPKKG